MIACAALLSLPLLVPSTPAPAPARYILVMVDVSASMPAEGLTIRGLEIERNLVSEAAAALAVVLSPDDAVWLGTFGGKVRLMTKPVPVKDLERYARDLSGDFGGPSPLWDALYFAAGLFQGVSGPRAIVVITDGRASANERSFADVLQRLKDARVPVFPMVPAERPDPRQPRLPDPAARLLQVAATTGGQYHVFQRGGLPAAFALTASAITR